MSASERLKSKSCKSTKKKKLPLLASSLDQEGKIIELEKHVSQI